MLTKNKKITISVLIAAVAIFSGVYFGVIRNTATAKLDQQFYQTPEIKSSYKLDNLSLILPAKDENSVEVKLGDNNVKEFTPNLEISRWEGEVKMKIMPQIAQAAAQEKTLEFDNEKINYKTPKEDYRFYDIPVNSEHPEGAYEFEVILKEKPASNVVSLDMETEGLNFYYQPPMSEELQNGNVRDIAVSANETTAFDKDGNTVHYRPENVVGSYAVYHATKRDHILGEKNYKTGKAFHIYRPKIIDANNKWVWGQLNIDTANNKLTITIPQNFLDSAVYPVIVDPTIGYTTIGGSGDVTNSFIVGSRFNCPTSGDANPGTLYMAASRNSGSSLIYGAAYENKAGDTVVGATRLSGSQSVTVDTTKQFYGVSITWTGLTQGTDYWLMMGGTVGIITYYDTSTPGYEDGEYKAWTAGEMPNPFPAGGTSIVWEWSVYVDYTAAGGGTTPIIIKPGVIFRGGVIFK